MSQNHVCRMLDFGESASHKVDTWREIARSKSFKKIMQDCSKFFRFFEVFQDFRDFEIFSRFDKIFEEYDENLRSSFFTRCFKMTLFWSVGYHLGVAVKQDYHLWVF